MKKRLTHRLGNGIYKKLYVVELKECEFAHYFSGMEEVVYWSTLFAQSASKFEVDY